MAATVDVISGGRLELGIGAGIQEKEHVAYGFGFPSLDVRVEQLAEAIQVIKLLWTQNKASFQGKHFTLKDAVCEPEPLQKPHPPITVGGSSQLLMQKATAPYADRFDWGFQPIEEYKRKLGFLENQCRTVGRDFMAIEKSCWPSGQVLIVENESELNEKIAKYKPAGVSLAEFEKTTLAGTPEQCIKQLQVYLDLGVTAFMLYFADFPKTDGSALFAKEVADKIS
jgi:alkanesulfonate monooxygenase SsuD/methylene tetrahydromethanopterin reductase-like flavin-dependent oxidoreductase (luciferase family)